MIVPTGESFVKGCCQRISNREFSSRQLTVNRTMTVLQVYRIFCIVTALLYFNHSSPSTSKRLRSQIDILRRPRQTCRHHYQLLRPTLNLAIRLIYYLVLRRKLHANTIDTMSLVRRRRVSLALEHMSQMTPTVRADNLCSLHSECAIGVASDSTWDVIEVCRPSAARLELVGSFVERSITSSAGVHSSIWHVLIVFAGEGSFGALFSDYAELL